jgi:hypothetical protein
VLFLITSSEYDAAEADGALVIKLQDYARILKINRKANYRVMAVSDVGWAPTPEGGNANFCHHEDWQQDKPLCGDGEPIPKRSFAPQRTT